ncbi:MAG: DEAD/DEAH box helicase [Clostridiaceae bacterium]|nr:DEAD/DEAH box helicase [Clostridiaceae bacterium]
MSDLSAYQDRIVHERTVPRREAAYADFPVRMLPELREYLEERGGIRRLYVHQAEMFDRAIDGENVVITTSTASGKTLGFLLPILQEILNNPRARAIFLYPTKALAADQYRHLVPLLEWFGKNRIQAGVYDGDTPVNERSRIRNNANIILTNPDMLNTAFLAHHAQYGFNFLFSNLKYVVIDELHTYRGAFGSHLANLMRRLGRISRYYRSRPRFLCSSATIANPVELAQAVCGCPFSLVDRDGSPAPEKTYHVWQPPIVDLDYRVPPTEEAALLIPHLVTARRSFIAFCKSRKAVEVVLREARDKLRSDGALGRDEAGRIAGYRGGYLPEERKEIERKMVSGQLQGLVSTNALELGIDIGSVECTVLTGFPGTRASFWQQSGRSGRTAAASSTYLILDNLPQDQYIAIDPEWLFSTGVEHAVVDPGNLFIQIAHVRAAAAELPLSPDDVASFPDLGEIVPVLVRARELRPENGRYVWTGTAFPSGDFSLRNMDNARFKMKNTADDSVITEMDELQACREAYPGAIYMHEGQMYQVERHDPVGRLAEAKPTDLNYYTVPNEVTEVEPVQEIRKEGIGRVVRHFGDVRVTNTVVGYKRIQFHNHQNLGYEELSPALSKTFETEGLWIDLPTDVSTLFRKYMPQKEGMARGFWKDYFYGLGYALLAAVGMATMTTAGDVGMAYIPDGTGNEPRTAVCVFDLYTGGLGFAEKAYDNAADIVHRAIRMVGSCRCRDGCPACVGDYKLDKAIVLWGLQNLFDELPPPLSAKIPEEAPRIYVEKQYRLAELPGQWEAFTDYLSRTGEYMTDFLRAVPSARVEGKTLVLRVGSAFERDWMSDPANAAMLRNLIEHHVSVPRGFLVTCEVVPEGGDDQESAETRRARIERRYRDIDGGTPPGEQA